MSKTDIKKLIKKGLTGEEVAKLFIKDYITMFNNSRNELDLRDDNKVKAIEADGLFTNAEKDTLYNSFNDSENIKQYNLYNSVFSYIRILPNIQNTMGMQVEICFWKAYIILKKFIQVDLEKSKERFMPTIMTQKQYDELKQKDFEYKMTLRTSVESLIFQTLEYYWNIYKKGDKTPFNKYFEKEKEKPITNPRIKSNYWAKGEGGYYLLPDGRTSKDMPKEQWQEEVMKRHHTIGSQEPNTFEELKWVEDLSAPEDATKWEVLKYAQGFYYSQETDSKITLWEFKEDYPELYKAIIDKIASMKGLSIIKDLKEDEYFNDDLISWEDLYNNKILDYPKMVDSFDGGADSPVTLGGIAILQENSTWYPKKNINEKGYYEKDNFYLKTLSENLDKEIEYLTWHVKDIKLYTKLYFATDDAINLTSERIEMPEIKKLKLSSNIVDLIETLNSKLDDVYNLKYLNIGKKVKEQVTKVNIKELKPSIQTIKKAKELIKDLSFYKYNETYLHTIIGEELY